MLQDAFRWSWPQILALWDKTTLCLSVSLDQGINLMFIGDSLQPNTMLQRPSQSELSGSKWFSVNWWSALCACHVSLQTQMMAFQKLSCSRGFVLLSMQRTQPVSCSDCGASRGQLTSSANEGASTLDQGMFPHASSFVSNHLCVSEELHHDLAAFLSVFANPSQSFAQWPEIIWCATLSDKEQLWILTGSSLLLWCQIFQAVLFAESRVINVKQRCQVRGNWCNADFGFEPKCVCSCHDPSLCICWAWLRASSSPGKKWHPRWALMLRVHKICVSVQLMPAGFDTKCAICNFSCSFVQKLNVEMQPHNLLLKRC